MRKEENSYCSENGIKQHYSENGTIQKHERGVTLVALVVTIIVLLILAGISLNLIGGSNGILSRAQKAASTMELAKLKESKELADAAILIDMYAEGETYKTLHDYITDKCEQNGASGGDKILDTENGSYWLDDDGNLHYKDNDTGSDAKVIQDSQGNPSIKEVTDNKGNVQDMTTESTIKSEIDSAIADLKKEWQKSGSDKDFDKWLEEKCEKNGGSFPTSTGGIIASNGDETFTYEDDTTPPNIGDFSVDKNGNINVENVEINKSEIGGDTGTTLPVKDLTIADITFDKKIAGTDQWNPDWINQSVVVTAVPNTDLTGYTLQTSKNNVTWKNVDNQTFTTNGTFYVRAFNGKRFGKAIQTEVTNIDKKAPEIAVETTTNSYSITMMDEISKIAGYKITETADEPETFDELDLKETFTATGEGTPGKTYYAWAKDKAGNVTMKEFTLREIPAVSNNDFNYTYEPAGWTNQDVLVTAEFKTGVNYAGYTIQTNKDGSNWESDNAQNFAENGKMFVRLVDNKGNAGRTTAEATVDKIDKVDPTIDTVTATTKSYQFEASDEGSGLAGYQITEDEEEPTTFETITSGAKTFTSPIMENQKNDRAYYIWLKDVAGNVIYRKVNLQAVDTATETNISVKSTVWSGTSATVTFETTSTYQMQICTKASKNDEDWENKSVVTVESGTPIYVRLWDGVNGGNYYTHKPVITYQVQYNANGGSGTMANSTHEYGTAKALTANGFAKTGYTFAGWSTTAGGAKVYDNQASVTNLSSTNGATVNLFAVWTVNKYRFALGSGIGVSTSGSSGTADYDYGTTITLKATVSTGYTWKQWTSSNTGLVGNTTTANTTFTMPAGDVTMTPSATANTYTVVYNGNGNTGGSTASSSHTYDATKNLTANGFTKTCHNFSGWATSAGGAKVYNNSQSVSNLTAINGGTVNLFAVWTAAHNYVATELKDCSSTIQKLYKFAGTKSAPDALWYGSQMSFSSMPDVATGDLIYCTNDSSLNGVTVNHGYYRIGEFASNYMNMWKTEYVGESYIIHVCSNCETHYH